MDINLFIGSGRSGHLSHAEVLNSLDGSWDCSADCVLDSSFGVVLFNHKYVSSHCLDVDLESFRIDGLETENVQNSDVDTCIINDLPSSLSLAHALIASWVVTAAVITISLSSGDDLISLAVLFYCLHFPSSKGSSLGKRMGTSGLDVLMKTGPSL